MSQNFKSKVHVLQQVVISLINEFGVDPNTIEWMWSEKFDDEYNEECEKETEYDISYQSILHKSITMKFS
jgi:hypothetical protein